MAGVVLTARLWQLPMLLVSVVCALSFLARKLRPTLRECEVATFYEEDPEAPTVIEKALEAKKQLLDVQVCVCMCVCVCVCRLFCYTQYALPALF